MTAFKTILVPTDFSEASRHALQYACMLADASGASLELFHAIETPYVTGGYMELYPATGDVIERVQEAAREEMGKLLTPQQTEKYRAQIELRIGAPAPELLRYLNERPDIDLVVMSTHGRGAVARLLMGSVADRVVRSAPCPVVTLREVEGAAAPNATRAA